MYGAAATPKAGSAKPVVAFGAKSSTPAPFLPGQRVRDPKLGVGIVVRASDATVTVMFPGGTGMRTYPLLNCPLEEA
ncbi:MAG: hypothetical protein NZ556_08940 [Fimbriimonadales bacterium]|nr:hypothetical protein [Fimbriimonadales bacterium]